MPLFGSKGLLQELKPPREREYKLTLQGSQVHGWRKEAGAHVVLKGLSKHACAWV